MTTTYEPIADDKVPGSAVFLAPRRLMGQIIEIEYGCMGAPVHTDAYDDGALYMRRRDQSVGPAWTYYKRAK